MCPTSVLRGVGAIDPRQFSYPPSYRPNDTLIGVWSWCAAGSDLAATVGSTILISRSYPLANRALGFMFCLGDNFLVRKVWWANGTTTGTNSADVGVYDEPGTTLLVSAGSTLITGATAVQEVDVTDTLLKPGRYWCVYNQTGTVDTPIGTAGSAATNRAAGLAQMAGAVPLGSTFTPAAIAATMFPLFGIASRTQVA